ncbi:c-type cytochrome [Defluviimonas salinarum]|uniref:Cytochrome c n=1 Tax=Defluviimonas salinarum TaxID=2992147 RepID=A0ABT3J5B4_9RHOB|nr:cytochrome c [Defluviimonas salinarum]MCW3782884.1 cytochrome c [Defluviimonas salinarum]
MTNHSKIVIACLLAAWAAQANAQEPSHRMSDDSMRRMMSAGLVLPKMDAARGRELFASKGCVVCHSVNGVGGQDAPMLDADLMELPMNPFEFAARMWRGAPAMVEAQEDELGGQIEFTGEELSNIIAFVHDSGEQKQFTAPGLSARCGRSGPVEPS